MVVADGSGRWWWQMADGRWQWQWHVNSKSRSMRNYLFLGNGASGDCLTASAPIWVSLC